MKLLRTVEDSLIMFAASGYSLYSITRVEGSFLLMSNSSIAWKFS